MRNPGFRYYLITDRLQCSPNRVVDVVDEACRNGIKGVQLREKDLSARELYKLAGELYAVTKRWQASLYINDRADIAMAVGARGVQCREDGIGPADVKKLSRSLAAGASAHSIEAAGQAEREGADFIVFGPVYYTESKAPFGEPQGIARLREVVAAVDIPVFAVGGVTTAKASACLKAGAFGIAGISSVMGAESIESVVAGYQSLLGVL